MCGRRVFVIVKLKIKFKLHQARLLHNVTQKELARKCGFSQSYISLLELNKQSPTLKTIEILSNALEVYPNTLFEIELY